jgi:hypothetical protein
MCSVAVALLFVVMSETLLERQKISWIGVNVKDIEEDQYNTKSG